MENTGERETKEDKEGTERERKPEETEGNKQR